MLRYVEIKTNTEYNRDVGFSFLWEKDENGDVLVWHSAWCSLQGASGSKNFFQKKLDKIKKCVIINDVDGNGCDRCGLGA